METQLKMVHKVYNVVDQPHRKIFVTMRRYNVKYPDTCYVQIRLFGKQGNVQKEGKFYQMACVNYKYDEFLQLIDIMSHSSDKILNNQPLVQDTVFLDDEEDMDQSTVPCEQEPEESSKIEIINGNAETIFEMDTAIAHCISADAKMGKGFAKQICERMSSLQEYCRGSNSFVGSVIPYKDNNSNRLVYNLVTKWKFYEKPTLQTVQQSLKNMRSHAQLNNISAIVMPKIGSGLDQLNWNDVYKLIKDTFFSSGINIQIITIPV